MNICMFTNTYQPHVGGVAKSVHTFAADLRGSGKSVATAKDVSKKKQLGEYFPLPGTDSQFRMKP